MAQVKRIGGLKKVGLLLGVCAALLLGAMGQKSYALTLNSTPDIYVDGVTVSYDASTDALSAAFYCSGQLRKRTHGEIPDA